MTHVTPPQATIVVPAFNVAKTISETLKSLQSQTMRDCEILVVDDGSTDDTAQIVAPFLTDPRLRYIKQANRGLAGARNTGIAAAHAPFIGFCDADDLWHPDKLRRHVKHLRENPNVGVSYSGSQLINANSAPLAIRQSPRLTGITASHIIKRNPVGNGSAMVIRAEALTDIAFRAHAEDKRLSYFDETFRQSEDIECWVRMALTTDWTFEGISGALTLYRVAGAGLSAQTDRQLASWENAIAKLRPLSPAFFERHEGAARAYQLRYLARRAISGGNGPVARKYLREAFYASLEPLWAEPFKTFTTLAASWAVPLLRPRSGHS